MKNDLLHQTDTNTVKALVNWVAAFLGIGTFLGVVNLAVGVLSAAWLTVQIYGYMVHELPLKCQHSYHTYLTKRNSAQLPEE